jgi:hypothetical protein
LDDRSLPSLVQLRLNCWVKFRPEKLSNDGPSDDTSISQLQELLKKGIDPLRMMALCRRKQWARGNTRNGHLSQGRGSMLLSSSSWAGGGRVSSTQTKQTTSSEIHVTLRILLGLSPLSFATSSDPERICIASEAPTNNTEFKHRQLFNMNGCGEPKFSAAVSLFDAKSSRNPAWSDRRCWTVRRFVCSRSMSAKKHLLPQNSAAGQCLFILSLG